MLSLSKKEHFKFKHDFANCNNAFLPSCKEYNRIAIFRPHKPQHSTDSGPHRQPERSPLDPQICTG